MVRSFITKIHLDFLRYLVDSLVSKQVPTQFTPILAEHHLFFFLLSSVLSVLSELCSMLLGGHFGFCRLFLPDLGFFFFGAIFSPGNWMYTIDCVMGHGMVDG